MQLYNFFPDADLWVTHTIQHRPKVTPDGEVSTFAGRGSVGIDGRVWGWIDGEARETARFREPTGICYDEEEETFYVADRENKRIRTISVE